MKQKTSQKSEFSVIKSKTTAVLVDLSFFIERYNTHKHLKDMTPDELAKRLKDYVFESVRRNEDFLYRIYVYDCEPLNKNVPMPPLKANGDKSKNLSKTSTYNFRSKLLQCLRRQPYFAIRLGDIDENSFQWKIKNYDKFKQLLRKEIDVDDLSDDDFVLDIRQKGVDIKIGLDIATLSNKHLVEKIILITADSDFIPAIKHARREGVIVQLDPMHLPETQIKKGLLEHIDILSSVFPNKNTPYKKD